MIPTEREDAPAGQQIEITVVVFIVEIRSLAAHVPFVEADRAQHADEYRIHMPGVQIVLAALLAIEPFEEVGVHSFRRRVSGFS